MSNVLPKVLVITGASRGIGAATARLAAREGWDVVVNYANAEAAAHAVAKDVEAAGRRAVVVKGDVANPADVEAIFAAADKLGALGGLVNNAGMTAKGARVDEMDAERIARIFAVNVTGSFLCARAAIRRMSTRHGGKGGAIVNVASTGSKVGLPGGGVDYASSKGAVDVFTIGLAQEVGGEGIRVNAVRPGIIMTDIHAAGGDPGRIERISKTLPIPRPGTAEEVAEAIVWLLSDKSAYVIGAFIPVSGGRGLAT